MNDLYEELLKIFEAESLLRIARVAAMSNQPVLMVESLKRAVDAKLGGLSGLEQRVNAGKAFFNLSEVLKQGGESYLPSAKLSYQFSQYYFSNITPNPKNP